MIDDEVNKTPLVILLKFLLIASDVHPQREKKAVKSLDLLKNK